MSIGERPQSGKRRVRLTVFGSLALVALIALGLAAYRRYLASSRPTLSVVYRNPSPVADGVIGANEYAPGLLIQWTADDTLAAFEHGFGDATTNKPPSDLQITLHAAYTATSLFFAFHVSDQFVDAQEEDLTTPHQNDGVEIFLDGDKAPNDFGQTMQSAGGPTLPSEGFQVLVDAAGHQFTRAQSLTDADWKRAVKRTPDGYIVEIEIPLALIDTHDGAGVKNPGPGSELNMAMAFTDNDKEVRKQVSYAYLRTRTQASSPYLGGEAAWTFGVRLEPRSWQLPW